MAQWIDAVASRSGPLLPAATRFTAAQGLRSDPPRGVAGLGALTRAIGQAQSQLSDAEDARQFLEGAGAYLALLLLDHFRDGAHASHDGQHRLCLGECGSFDPFAAVARALDADDASRTLLSELKLAEAEAVGCGPTARVVAEVRRVLEGLPGARIVRRFDQKLWLELGDTRVELDLTRVVEVTQGEPDAVLTAAVRRLCAPLLTQGSEVLHWAEARGRIYPRLVGPSFVGALPAERADLELAPLGSDVWQAFVLRTAERARFVRADEVRAWSAEGADVRLSALRNLARASQRARFLQHDTAHGPLISAETRDGLDAARALLPGLYELLAPRLGPAFLIGVPHRDTLLACSAEPALADELERRVRAAFRSAPHAISPRLWRVDGPAAFRQER